MINEMIADKILDSILRLFNSFLETGKIIKIYARILLPQFANKIKKITPINICVCLLKSRLKASIQAGKNVR